MSFWDASMWISFHLLYLKFFFDTKFVVLCLSSCLSNTQLICPWKKPFWLHSFSSFWMKLGFDILTLASLLFCFPAVWMVLQIHFHVHLFFLLSMSSHPLEFYFLRYFCFQKFCSAHFLICSFYIYFFIFYSFNSFFGLFTPSKHLFYTFLC